MGRYITVANVNARYTRVASDIGSASINSDYIPYAEGSIEGMLSPKYSVPFSDNNVTVKDLCIDAAYARMIRFKDSEKSELIENYIEKKVTALLEGREEMITSSGDAIGMDIQNAWSETQDYHPVFGKGDIIDFHADSSQLYDEELNRA